MGRGLSELQRTILRLALERRLERGDEDRRPRIDGDVQLAEILVAHYQWKPWRSGRMVCNVPDLAFDPDEIGREKYNSARSALSRAVIRLEGRGLIERWYDEVGIHGFFLSDAGISVARTLSVKLAPTEANLTDSGISRFP